MNDTIAAISTALGVGAISIVRLSGNDAIEIVNNCFKGKDLTKVASHTINYGHIVDKNENSFVFITPKLATRIYIKFIKDYHFESLPLGFMKEPSFDDHLMDWSKTNFDSISKVIDYYENNKKRNPNDVQKDIEKYNNLLLEWVKELPDINERNDE